MSFESNLLAFVQAAGGDVKALNLKIGDPSDLDTTDKANLVAAINEVFAAISGGGGGGGDGAVIDDEAVNGDTDVTYSADKILEVIAALRDELRAGASSALDTFKEVADQLAADETAAAALAAAVANRVRFDDAQALNSDQKAQARTNIGAASAADLSDLADAIGDTEQDLVAAYEAAKA